MSQTEIKNLERRMQVYINMLCIIKERPEDKWTLCELLFEETQIHNIEDYEELWKRRPPGKEKFDIWWRPHNHEKRIKVLEESIQEIKDKLI